MRKRTLWKRSVSILLALVMVLGTVNLAALGAGEAEDSDQEIVQTEDREELKGQEGSEEQEGLEESEGSGDLEGSKEQEGSEGAEGSGDQEGSEELEDSEESEDSGDQKGSENLEGSDDQDDQEDLEIQEASAYNLERVEKEGFVLADGTLTITGEGTFDPAGVAAEDIGDADTLVLDGFDQVNGFGGSGVFAGIRNLEVRNVGSIGGQAFYNYNKLESIAVENVSSVGMWAFGANPADSTLKRITLSNVETVGDYSFMNQSGLTAIAAGDVDSIGTQAFICSGALSSLELTNVGTVGDFAFYEAGKAAGGLKATLKGTNVTYTAGKATMFGSTYVTEIEVDGADYIDGFGFYGIPNLQKATIRNVKNLGTNGYPVFYGCGTGLNDVTIENVENAGVGATSGASGTIKVDVTLSYDANGGTGTMSAERKSGVVVAQSAAFTVADNGFTAPAGKAFTGWNTQADGKGQAYAAGSEFKLTATSILANNSRILYAQWEEVKPVTLTVWVSLTGATIDDLPGDYQATVSWTEDGKAKSKTLTKNSEGYWAPENNAMLWSVTVPADTTVTVSQSDFDVDGKETTVEVGQGVTASGDSWQMTVGEKGGTLAITNKYAFVCTCTEKCVKTVNEDCPVCAADKSKCASKITMVELHIYTHFTMRDQYVYLKDHLHESELEKVKKLFEDNQPEKESIVDTHSLTYSYTVNGEKTEVTLNGKTEGVEKVNFDQNYTYDGEGNLVESGHFNDAAWHWAVRIPVADGTRGTNIDFTQTGYNALTNRDSLDYVNTSSTGYMSNGTPHLSAGTKDGSGKLSVYGSDAEGSVHLHVYNNFEVPDMKEQAVGYMWFTPDNRNWDDIKPEGGWYLPGTIVEVDAAFQKGTKREVDGKTYVFSGWAGQYTSGGDGIYGTPVTVENDRITITNSVRFEGRWTEKTYTVTYTDGVEGREVFADQVNSGLKKGDATPAFSGTPSRDGYTFLGWTPTVVDTVAGDATYAAQWRANSGGGGGDSTTYYTLTVRYVYEDGSEAAAAFGPRSYASGYRYSVASPAIGGYTADILSAEGTLTRNMVITVTYTANEEELPEEDTPLTEKPTETPASSETPAPDEGPEEELPEEDTPLSELPGEPIPETPAEAMEEDLIDEETPLADVPQTGDGLGRALWSAMTLVSAAGLVILARTGRRKEEQEG